MRRRYYNPVRAWYQHLLYRPVEALWNRWGVRLPDRLDDRVGAWLYQASGAGRISTRREAKRRRILMASLPLTPRERFQPKPPTSPTGGTTNE